MNFLYNIYILAKRWYTIRNGNERAMPGTQNEGIK